MYVEDKKSIGFVMQNKKDLDEKYLNKSLIENKDIKKRVITAYDKLKTFGLFGFIKKAYYYKAKGGIYDRYLPYDPSLYSTIEQMDDIFVGKKIAVYSTIYGGYDTIKRPLFVNSNIDYILFTDRSDVESDVWQIRDINTAEFQKMDSYHKSKYCKVFPHIILPEYDITMWVDGNILLVGDIYPVILSLGVNDIGIFDNPVHDCIFTEARFLKYIGRVDENEINKQIKSYKKEGFPEHFGMRENSIIIRKKESKQVQKLMNDWWNEMQIFTMRDQISLPYVLWKNDLSIDYVNNLGITWRWNPRFLGESHKWEHRYDQKS